MHFSPQTSKRAFERAFVVLSVARGLAVAGALVFMVSALGCDRPLVVKETAQGAELLALSGEQRVEGCTTRPLRYGTVELPKGTKVRVGETWLVRKNEGSPSAYRIKGFYDPSTRSDGFVLPARAVNVFFNCAVGPDYEKLVPVPQEAFARDAQ